jgi:glycosyltransferase involved in cell wall biosynthesis
MKICILTNNTRTDNGWGRLGREFVQALRRKNHSVTLLSEEGGGLADEQVILDSSLRFSLNGFWRSTLVHLPFLMRNSLRARRIFAGHDVIHALDGYPYSVIARLGTAGTKLPYVATLIGTYSFAAFENFLERKLLSQALANAASVTSISRYTSAQILEHMPGLKITTIGLGTSSSWLTEEKSATSLVQKPYIISVGAIKPQKGHAVSLRAFAEAKKLFPSLSYVIVGNLGHRHLNEIKTLARSLGVADNIKFFSELPDKELVSLYDNAELFVLTPVRIGSFFEGFGLVYREAGARGLAVIGSKDCGAGDAVEDGKTGILIKQGDAEGVAKAMITLLKDSGMRQKMGENGKALASYWTWDRIAEEYIDIYQKILSLRIR